MNNKGSSLVEYALPLALVGIVVGTGIYYMFSNNSVLSFFNSTSNSSYDADSQTTVFNKNKPVDEPILADMQKGPLGGTPDVSVKQCTNGLCDIDFGEYILTGIPENFSEFVESAGNPGTTDYISSVFE